MKGLWYDIFAQIVAMSLGPGPQLIATLLANISYYKPFIHTKRSWRPRGHFSHLLGAEPHNYPVTSNDARSPHNS